MGSILPGKVADSIPRNPLLNELLVAFIMLLARLRHEPERFTQDSLDQLLNLTVIFSKMIKQSPELFQEIDETLKLIIRNVFSQA